MPAFVDAPWFVWPLALTVVAILALVLALAGFLRSRTWLSACPTFREVPEGAPLAPGLAHAVERSEPDLVKLGYTRGPTIASDDVSNDVSMAAVMYANPRESTLAMIVSMHSRTKAADGSENVTERSHTEFSTELVDGVCVTTNNSLEAGFGPLTPDRPVLTLPAESVPTLHRVHRAALERRGACRPLPPGAWWIDVPRKSVEQFLERCERHGYMRRDEEGNGRLTWKGALIALATNVPPGKAWWRWRFQASGRRMLAAVGRA
jgi:hypothetical protein